MDQTPAYLIYQTFLGTRASLRIRSVAKTAGSPITLTACDRPTNAQAFVEVIGDNVYCGPAASVANPTEAAAGVRVVGPDGVLRTTLPNTAMLSRGSRVGATDPRPTLLLLATNLSSATPGFAGSTIQSFDGVSGSLVATYGTFPMAAGSLSAPIVEYAGYPKVMYAYPSTDVSVSPEIYVLRDSPPSLTRRTFNYP